MTNTEIMANYVSKARKAMEIFHGYSQEEIDRVIYELCVAFKNEAETMAKMTLEETHMGDYDSKIMKLIGAPAGIWATLKGEKSVGVIGEDKEKKLRFVAHPKGVIGNVAPTTNPNVTTIFVSCLCLKGRNACIISPHPGAKNTTLYSVNLMRDTLERIGAPVDLVQGIEEPSKEMSRLLMEQCDATVATGGKAMVDAAYSSGRPAFGVGPGNVQGILDFDFDDLEQYAADCVVSRAFDNGIVCADTQAFIIPADKHDTIVSLLEKNKAYVTKDPKEIDQLRKVIFHDGKPNPECIGRPASRVAELAGFTVPEGTAIIVAEMSAAEAGKGDPLYGEKMCPVAILIDSHSLEESVDIARRNLLYTGAGHSIGIHTNTPAHADYASMELPVCRVLVNQPAFVAANPALTNGLSPTCSLGCGSWGNNSISENLTFQHLMNIARVSYPLDPEDVPDLNGLFD